MADQDPADTITVRRSKRSSAAISPVKPAEAITPSAKRPRKKARFSDSILPSGTTGLTPAVGKAILKTPRRHTSTPAISRFQDHDEVQFTPFKQVLSERTTRRIRRHGISDVQNQYYSEKRSNGQLRRQLEQTTKELQSLKEEVEAAKLHKNSDVPYDFSASQQRIDQLEDRATDLTQRSMSEDSGLGSSSPHEDDCGFQIYEDDSVKDDRQADDDDDVTLDLELETAGRAKEEMFRSSQSFSTRVVRFEDSPVRHRNARLNVPRAPQTNAHDLTKQINDAINRAEEAELAYQTMTAEIKSLGFPYSSDDDAGECISSIKTHFREVRLEFERIAPGEITISFHNGRLMPEMISKLKLVASQVRDREIELRSMREQQRSLKGNFDHALIAAETANARIKGLEDAVDKNAEDMLEQRMRAQALERESKEHEKNNQSLIAAIEKYRQEVKRLEELVELIEAESVARMQDVRTATAAEYTQQISDMDANVAAETTGRRAAEESAVERLRKISDLESVLSTARHNADKVKGELQVLEERFSAATRAHAEEVDGLHSRITGLSTSLNSAEAQIAKLTAERQHIETLYRSEVERNATHVATTNSHIDYLAAKLKQDNRHHARKSKVELANWELTSDDLPSDPIIAPMTPSSIVRFSEYSEVEGDSEPEGLDSSDDHIEGSVTLSRGKKHRRQSSLALPASSPFLGAGILKRGRRRYDSGIGMDSSSGPEDEGDARGMSPELSSEADVEMDNEVVV